MEAGSVSSVVDASSIVQSMKMNSYGDVKVVCRVRPRFGCDDICVKVIDNVTLRVDTSVDVDDSDPRYFEFDRVYGPHIRIVSLFRDVQPLVHQSALFGDNVAIFAYGHARSGKTYTMEGSSDDPGLYARCFNELFELSKLTTHASKFSFSVSTCQLHNEQFSDLTLDSGMKSLENFHRLGQEEVDNPDQFRDLLKAAFNRRDTSSGVSHLIVTVRICNTDGITEEKSYSKISLVELAAVEEDSGEHAAGWKSLSGLGAVLNSLTLLKGDSALTKVLTGLLGRTAKALLIVNVRPDLKKLGNTLSSLRVSARVINAIRSRGIRDTNKEWRDIGHSTGIFLHANGKEVGSCSYGGDASSAVTKVTNGYIKVICRVRPPFKNKIQPCVEVLDEVKLRVINDGSSIPEEVFTFDRVYADADHAQQVDLFSDVQPFVWSALAGQNVAIIAHGQACSGKTMLGSGEDHGLYARCINALFHRCLFGMYTSNFSFSVSISELHNEKIQDLLKDDGNGLDKFQMEPSHSSVELVRVKVKKPKDFTRAFGFACTKRDPSKKSVSHLIVTLHISHMYLDTGLVISYNKMSLVELAGSESMESLSALEDALISTSQKDVAPHGKSELTRVLADPLGRNPKILLIVDVCTDASCATLSSLARIKKLGDIGKETEVEKSKEVGGSVASSVFNTNVEDSSTIKRKDREFDADQNDTSKKQLSSRKTVMLQ